MTIQAGAGAGGFDPFELPDTIQLGTADNPYPHLAAARRKGPVQLEWPLPDDVGTVDEDRDPSFNVLGVWRHDATAGGGESDGIEPSACDDE